MKAQCMWLLPETTVELAYIYDIQYPNYAGLRSLRQLRTKPKVNLRAPSALPGEARAALKLHL